MLPLIQSTISWSFAPGVNARDAGLLERQPILVGDDAAAEDRDVAAAARGPSRIAGKSVMCAPEGDRVDVLLDRGLGDHLRR
jgi:hypothetical protein